MKPMLAKVFEPKRVTFPAFVQPKLNGIRATWRDSMLHSRGRPGEDGKAWKPAVLPHIFEALKSCGLHDVWLDGELYKHGMSLQEINSRVAVNRLTPHDDVYAIEYHIFDLVTLNPQSERFDYLQNLFNEKVPHDSPLKLVDTQRVDSINEFDAFHSLYRQQLYEGSMWRDFSAPYGLARNCSNQDNRWTCLLKRKEFIDANCLLLDILPSEEGQFMHSCGRLQLQMPSGAKFYSGSGLTHHQRQVLWQNRDNILKQKTMVRIHFDELSDLGIPVRNRIESIDNLDA